MSRLQIRKYSSLKVDPLLMGCEDCHGVHSISWAIGYWVGFIEGEGATMHKGKK